MPFLLCLLITLLPALGTGCRLFKSAANVPGEAVQAVTPAESPNSPPPTRWRCSKRLMRFSDEYLISMDHGMDKLRRGTNAPIPQNC